MFSFYRISVLDMHVSYNMASTTIDLSFIIPLSTRGLHWVLPFTFICDMLNSGGVSFLAQLYGVCCHDPTLTWAKRGGATQDWDSLTCYPRRSVVALIRDVPTHVTKVS